MWPGHFHNEVSAWGDDLKSMCPLFAHRLVAQHIKLYNLGFSAGLAGFYQWEAQHLQQPCLACCWYSLCLPGTWKESWESGRGILEGAGLSAMLLPCQVIEQEGTPFSRRFSSGVFGQHKPPSCHFNSPILRKH
jgi:hypothetical protein